MTFGDLDSLDTWLGMSKAAPTVCEVRSKTSPIGLNT